jgi:hypothetical protein
MSWNVPGHSHVRTRRKNLKCHLFFIFVNTLLQLLVIIRNYKTDTWTKI